MFRKPEEVSGSPAIEKLAWFLETHPEYGCARGYPVGDDPGPVMTSGGKAAGHCGVIPEFLGKATVSQKNGSRRLLLLAPFLEIGGADKFNLDLIEVLQRDHSYEVAVVATLSSPHRWRERFEALTPDVFTLHTFLPVEHYGRFLQHLIAARKPDTVLIAGCRAGYELLPALRTAGGPSFIDYLHIEDPDPRGYPQLSLKYARFLDATIVSSEYLRARQIAAGGDPTRIHVATTNIDPQVWDRSRFQQTARKAPVIACVGRITKQKQPDVMAVVLKTLRDRGVEFTCLVAGDGDRGRWLAAFVAKQGLTQVKLLGAQSSEQVQEILASSDIFFLPSESEGIALALFEAMSMGVVPVAARVGGQAELVTEDCGVLVQPGADQVKEYADELERLLRDSALRASMAVRARGRICEHFALDAMGGRMADLFEIAATGKRFDPAIAPPPENESPKRSPGVTLRLLLSPRNFVLKVKNLTLLARILLSSQKRTKLSASFDPKYYLSHQRDVAASGVSPLLHYAVQGYLEGRLPSRFYDATGGSHDAPDGLNPLLWEIATNAAGRA
ncbi:MAG TPA: glycosyltransferase family 4 protein [Bryobacteraceae bacterium]|nr:glycosyltransferase family 4 protein [Bryobacteraceae bacterium]